MNNKITVEETKMAKRQLERHILDDIVAFEELTGLKVDMVIILRSGYTPLGNSNGKTESVRINTDL